MKDDQLAYLYGLTSVLIVVVGTALLVAAYFIK
jgi:hypothetical protein